MQGDMKNWDNIKAQQYHAAQERNSGLLISSSTYEEAYLHNGHSIVIGTSSLQAVPRKFLGIVGQDPSDSKSSRLHVDIFQFCFIHVRYIL